MSYFTVSHSLTNSQKPDAYLHGADYNNDICISATMLDGVDTQNIDSISVYNNVNGTEIFLGTMSNAAGEVFGSGSDFYSLVVNSNDIYCENGIANISIKAWDKGNNLISAQSLALKMIEVPQVIDKVLSVKVDDASGNVIITGYNEFMDAALGAAPGITILGQEIPLTDVIAYVLPKVAITGDIIAEYDGSDFSYSISPVLVTNIGPGEVTKEFGPVTQISFNVGDLSITGSAGVTTEKASIGLNINYPIKEYPLIQTTKVIGVVPVTLELLGSISVGAGVEAFYDWQEGADCSISVSGGGDMELKLSANAGWTEKSFEMSLVKAGVYGGGSLKLNEKLLTEWGGELNFSLSCGIFIDSLSLRVGSFSFKGPSFRCQVANYSKTWKLTGDMRNGSLEELSGKDLYNDQPAPVIFSNVSCEKNGSFYTFKAQTDGIASVEAFDKLLNDKYEFVLRYAEVDKDGKFGQLNQKTVSFGVKENNACYPLEVTLALDDNKTYAYVFVALPADQNTGDLRLASSSDVFYTNPTISVENISVKEPSSTNMSTFSEATFVAKLSSASQNEVSFYWFTEGETAIEGEDYVGVKNGVVTFAPGETEKEFSVQIIGDGISENYEKFHVLLEAGNNAIFSATNTFDDDNTKGYADCLIKDSDTKGAAAVTVIDVSGSMSGNKIVSAKNAAYSFINNMNIGDYIGVVSFANSASTRYSLTQITSESTKSAAKSAVSGLYASGGTFIGSGIQQAANMLNGVDSEQKSIIVMTDGEDGNRTRTNNIVKNLPKDQYLIYGIGYGTQASAAVDALSVVNSDMTLSTSYASKTYMEELMDMCGGKYYYAASDEDLEDIYFELSARSSKQQIIVKDSDSVYAEDFIIESAIVDSACMSVRLGINWTNGDLDLVLWDPNGNYYDSSVNSEYIKFISTGTSEYYEITTPTKGVWGLGVVGKNVRGDEEAFDYYAIANSSIEANLEFDATRVAPNQQITVSCTVKNGDNNVLGASVYAKVLDSKGDYEFVDLFDDGMHGDGIANDGVYGNIISKDSSGVYKVTGYVEGTATMGDVFYRQTVEEQFQVDVNAKASLISVMGNFGGNGKTAIVQYDYAKSLNVTGWFAQEDGSMKWQFINTVAPGWEISKMTGDFTGDGSDDIMWINKDSGHIGTWQMDNGSCKWSILTITDFDDWSLQGIGDFNGDGTDDMLFRNRLNGLVGTLDTKNGEQVPSSWKVINGTTDAWQIAGTGDFNGDKKDDILLTNTVTGQVGIWEMTAQGTTNWKSVSFTDFAEWRIQGIGDFNGDDVDDILFANNTTGVVGFWGMENGANKDWTLIGIADVKSDWQISGIGDFNDDGIDEIAWTSPTSERIGCWTQDKEKLAQWSILA